jgi:hypothetical protein
MREYWFVTDASSGSGVGTAEVGPGTGGQVVVAEIAGEA